MSQDETNPLERHYWCFISYRHSDNHESGRQWANWLHQGLETYQVPKDLVGKTNNRGESIPDQIYPVFRDEQELSGGHLKVAIDEALERTKSLIVLCSHKVLQSPYVDEEIRTYKCLRDAEIRQSKAVVRAEPMAAILEGTPDPARSPVVCCIPPALRFEVDECGALTERASPESLWIDFRLPDGNQGWTSAAAYREELEQQRHRTAPIESRLSDLEINCLVEAYSKQLEVARLKVIAVVLGVPFGELHKRDKAYQIELAAKRARALRRWLGALAFLSIVASAFGWLSVAQAHLAEKRLVESRAQTGRLFLSQAEIKAKEWKQVESLFYAGRAVGFEGLGKEPGKSIPPWQKLFGFQASDDPYPHLLGHKPLSAPVVAAAYDRIRLSVALPPHWCADASSDYDVAPKDIAWCPDGRTLATCSGYTVTLWDVAFGKCIATMSGHGNAVWSLAWSPDGKRLATASWDKSVKVWDVKNQVVMVTLNGHTEEVEQVRWSPDGKRLASCGDDKTTRLWDSQTGMETMRLNHAASVESVAWSPDGQSLLTTERSYSDPAIKIWEVETGELKSELKALAEDAVWSPDGLTIASVGPYEITLWEVETGQVKHRIAELSLEDLLIQGNEDLGTGIASIEWSADSKLLAVAYGDRIQVREAATGTIRTCLRGHSGKVGAVRWGPDGNTLASASSDGSIMLWTATRRFAMATVSQHAEWVTGVTWSPDGQSLATGGYDGKVYIWDAATGAQIAAIDISPSFVESVAWSPNGKRLALVDGYREQIRVYNALNGASIPTTMEARDAWGVSWSPNGKMLASWGEDDSIQIWDSESQKLRSTLEGHRKRVGGVAWHPDGAILASCSDDHTIRLWKVETGLESGRIESSARALAWSPDGKILATGSRIVELWDTLVGEPTGRIEGHTAPVTCLAWNPDGRTLATGSKDGVIKLWDSAGREQKSIFQDHKAMIRGLAWSPNGRTLASASNDCTVNLWTVIDEPIDLHRYLKEGWCSFDPATTEINWKRPKGKTEFRNVPTNSWIAVLQNSDLPTAEKDLLLFEKSLGAQSWDCALAIRDYLSPETLRQNTWARSTAARKLQSAVESAIEAKHSHLADLRISQGDALLPHNPVWAQFRSKLCESYGNQIGAALWMKIANDWKNFSTTP